MERLTKIDGVGQDEIIRCLDCNPEKAGAGLENCGNCDHWQRVVDKLAEYEEAEADGRLLCIPFSKGDTVCFVKMVECYECERSQTCPGYRSGRPENGQCPLKVYEEEVEDLTCVVFNSGDEVFPFLLNDTHPFDSLDRLHPTQEDAEKELAQAQEEQKKEQERVCRVCGCTWNTPCPGGCWWVEEDLCSNCVDMLGELTK